MKKQLLLLVLLFLPFFSKGQKPATDSKVPKPIVTARTKTSKPIAAVDSAIQKPAGVFSKVANTVTYGYNYPELHEYTGLHKNDTLEIFLENSTRDLFLLADSTQKFNIKISKMPKSGEILDFNSTPVTVDTGNNLFFSMSKELRGFINDTSKSNILLKIRTTNPEVKFAFIKIKWNKKTNPGGNTIAAVNPGQVSIPYTFLPNVSDYAIFYGKINKAPGLNKSDTLKEYRIIYDFKNHSIKYPLRKHGKMCVNLNTNIVFQVINVNPLVHTVTLNHTTANLNTELESEFMKFLAVPDSKKPDGGSSGSQGSDKKNLQPSEKEKILVMFITLSNELQLFYDKKINDANPDLALYNEELGYIKEKIKNTFAITGVVNKQSILEKGAALIADLGNAELAKKYEASIQNVAELIGKLDDITYTVATGPIQPGNNDEIVFNLSITKGNSTIVNTTPYKIMIAGGWKADFSIGFYGTGLKDDTYTLQPDTTKKVNNQKIIKDYKGQNDIGMMLAGHFYPRTGYRVNSGITFGFGLDTDKNTRYLLGTSLILGYEKRIILTGGCVFGNRKVLASGLSEGQYYSGTAEGLHKTISSYGLFIGITFNFASFNLGK